MFLWAFHVAFWRGEEYVCVFKRSVFCVIRWPSGVNEILELVWCGGQLLPSHEPTGSELMLKILIPRWKGLKHSWLARGPGGLCVVGWELPLWASLCVCVCVCVCVCDVGQLECSACTTEIFPRTSLYVTQKPSDMPFSFFLASSLNWRINWTIHRVTELGF